MFYKKKPPAQLDSGNKNKYQEHLSHRERNNLNNKKIKKG